MLLDSNKLTIKRDDLIGNGPYHARQFNSTLVSELIDYSDEVVILRIGDTQKEKELRNNPKEFAKKYIKCNRRFYDGSNDFIEEYYSGKKVLNLVKNIKEYNRLKCHDNDEYYLADLLK